MDRLQKALYLSKQIRLCEQKAINELGIPEQSLMAKAGAAAFHTLKSLYPDVRSIAIFCGVGNNAGDGYVLATLAHQQGYSVMVYFVKTIEDLPPAAHHAALAAIAEGVPCHYLEDTFDSDVELIVDGLLGIGIQGNVRDPIAHAIHLINDSGLPVLALDVPSGLEVDTGRVLGVCVRADVTVTFIGRKVGMYTLDGPDHCGKVVCHTLHLESTLANLQPSAYLLDEQLFQGVITPRCKNSHKGMYGHVLIVGGGFGMPGAVSLAAHAALRVGAGLVSIATLPQHVGCVSSMLPEALVYAMNDVSDLVPLLKKATVCVIGPGLGEDEWAESLFSACLAAQLPLVIDASALRLLASDPQHDDNWLLTPHPGEAAGLLGCKTMDVQNDRCKAAHLIQQQYGGCVLLKGVGTIINSGEQNAYICAAGNPGMASAGMGDVLSGVVGGLLAQGVCLNDAARLGVWLHARAADEAVATLGERGLMASDLMPYLRRQINAIG